MCSGGGGDNGAAQAEADRQAAEAQAEADRIAAERQAVAEAQQAQADREPKRHPPRYCLTSEQRC